ncbi:MULTISPECIES: hypothetical protein [unclassified Microbacterium]|uniref:hypothetical protein n=1 Tax=unclassified Microbacterium TaxID=2609290 RepID=UPI00301953C2
MTEIAGPPRTPPVGDARVSAPPIATSPHGVRPVAGAAPETAASRRHGIIIRMG